MGEPIKMPFGGGADLCGSKELCSRWGQDLTNPFTAARDNKSAVRPFAKILWMIAIFHFDQHYY